MIYDVIILGSGPAGFTAAIYTQRFGLSTVLVAGRKWGGQLMQTTDVENFPGFAKITGPELMLKMRDQVVGLGVKILDLDFTKLDASSASSADNSSRFFIVTAEDQRLEGKSVICATGADTKWLGVPNEERLRGHGVSSCAPCDAFFFKGKSVAVVGGGDTAMEEAQVISRVASDVILIHRRDEFKAGQAMLEKVAGMKNVRFLYNTKVIDVIGESFLTGILLETSSISPKQRVSSMGELVSSFGGRQIQGKENQWVLSRQGLFVAIGLTPNTQKYEGIELDSHGYVKRFEERDATGVINYFTRTNVAGIFTAGDVHDAHYKQAITAAAFGCMAAIDVQSYLAEHH